MAVRPRMDEAIRPTVVTPGGTFRVLDYGITAGGREWTVGHIGAVVSRREETRAIVLKTNGVSYGLSLWPGAMVLAEEVAGRDDWAGKAVLELGAGVGLPGIVAAGLGARVVQTDHDELVLDLCRRNAARNGLHGVECRPGDWTAWTDTARYDVILGADILYVEELSPHLRRIFESNLAPGGRVLLTDPFRPMSVRFLDSLEADGWGVTVSNWDVGDEILPRPIGVFELIPPGFSPG